MTNETKTQKLIGIKDLFRNSWNIYKKDLKPFLEAENWSKAIGGQQPSEFML